MLAEHNKIAAMKTPILVNLLESVGDPGIVILSVSCFQTELMAPTQRQEQQRPLQRDNAFAE